MDAHNSQAALIAVSTHSLGDNSFTEKSPGLPNMALRGGSQALRHGRWQKGPCSVNPNTAQLQEHSAAAVNKEGTGCAAAPHPVPKHDEFYIDNTLRLCAE